MLPEMPGFYWIHEENPKDPLTMTSMVSNSPTLEFLCREEAWDKRSVRINSDGLSHMCSCTLNGWPRPHETESRGQERPTVRPRVTSAVPEAI